MGSRVPYKTAYGLPPLAAVEIIGEADRDSGGKITTTDMALLMAYASRWKVMLNRREFREVVAWHLRGKFDFDKSPDKYPFYKDRDNDKDR